MVFGHLLYDSNLPILNQVIYSFHMPMFFLMSGFVQKSIISRDYIKRRANRLLTPYCVFTIIGMPLFGALILRNGGSIVDVIVDALYAKGVVSNNPLWFLLVLFEISCLIAVTKLPSRRKETIVVAWAISFCFGWLINIYNPKILNLFGFNRMIVCVSFYILGMLLKDRIGIFSSNQVTIICIMLNILFGVVLNPKVSIYGFNLNNYFFFYIAAVTGSVAIMSICNIVFNKESFLAEISRYAILMMGIQYFVKIPFSHLMKRLNLTKTYTCDVLIILMTCAIITFVPFAYNRIKSKLPLIRFLNGETEGETE